MTNSLSLRVRLTFVILAPLLLIAAIVGAWAYFDAQSRAAERFDRSLLSTALAISRDTAVTGGDALSEETRDLLRDTSGGSVFYHVYAPDGVFVTGYATPPIAPDSNEIDAPQFYYDATYQGLPVRALRFTQSMSIDGWSGLYTFSVWQNTAVRDGFVEGRTRPTFLIIASMIGALAVIVWFGVRLGLYPLIDLEDAIARRSADDLAPIKRRIPKEVSGIVGRLNGLLTELSRTLDAKNIFISDAAHQLRNPIAGVLSLAESLQNAQTLDDAKSRGADLLDAARETGKLANNLLTLERARAVSRPDSLQDFDAMNVLRGLSDRFAERAAKRSTKFDVRLSPETLVLNGDPVLFEQAILNLLDNAMTHGGETLDQVALDAHQTADALVVEVSDTGKGISPDDFEKAMSRFSQIGPGAGSGLGLPISKAIVEGFGGSVALDRGQQLFSVRLSFPIPTDSG